MDISSATATSSVANTTSPSQLQTEVLKKAQDAEVIQGQQDLKVMESAAAKAQEITAQKTGVGGNLNITG
ncbi:MAG: hypothetical protein ABGW74_03795 [Campylobacterales bacterium]|jgi:hypothetical protein